MTLAELLASASREGQRVSADQFRRWRGLGLIPAPAKTSPGRGKGVTATYGDLHLRQLTAVAEALRDDRRTARVMWKLWMDGFAIDERRILVQLKQTLKEIEKSRKRMRRMEQSDRIAKRFEEDAGERLFDHGLGQIRKRLRKDYPWLVHIIMQVVTGTYADRIPEDEALVLYALGFVNSREAAPDASIAPAGFLPMMSAQFTKDRLELGLRDLRHGDLTNARDALRTLKPALRAVMETAAGTLPLVGASTAEPLLDVPPRFAFAAWLGVRKHPKFEPIYNTLLMLPQLIRQAAATQTATSVPIQRT
jgi:hypothetical protein